MPIDINEPIRDKLLKEKLTLDGYLFKDKYDNVAAVDIDGKQYDIASINERLIKGVENFTPPLQRWRNIYMDGNVYSCWYESKELTDRASSLYARYGYLVETNDNGEVTYAFQPLTI